MSNMDGYLGQLLREHDPILAEMEERAKATGLSCLGPVIGNLLRTQAELIGARRVLEIGSGFGYSAWWFSHAVGPDGEVHLTENNPSDLALAEDFLTRSGFADRTWLHSGEAAQSMANIPGDFDVIFLDGRKSDYLYFLEAGLCRVRVGGLIMADNVLQKGRVADETCQDEDVRIIREFNRRIFAEPRLRSVIVPLRDGVSISMKVA